MGNWQTFDVNFIWQKMNLLELERTDGAILEVALDFLDVMERRLGAAFEGCLEVLEAFSAFSARYS